MKIFKELKKLGYKHYTEYTIEELDNLPLNSEERIIEQSLVLRWFREKYNLKISFPYWNGFNDNLPKNMQYKYECYIIPENAPSITIRYNDRIFFETYEEAELACLIKLIEIVNESKKD